MRLRALAVDLRLYVGEGASTARTVDARSPAARSAAGPAGERVRRPGACTGLTRARCSAMCAVGRQQLSRVDGIRGAQLGGVPDDRTPQAGTSGKGKDTRRRPKTADAAAIARSAATRHWRARRSAQLR